MLRDRARGSALCLAHGPRSDTATLVESARLAPQRCVAWPDARRARLDGWPVTSAPRSPIRGDVRRAASSISRPAAARSGQARTRVRRERHRCLLPGRVREPRHVLVELPPAHWHVAARVAARHAAVRAEPRNSGALYPRLFPEPRRARLKKSWSRGCVTNTSMITKQSHSTIYVTDQDRAKAFYTEKLGFEVRDDAKMGNFRWLTVGPKAQPDTRIILFGIQPSMFMTEEHAGMLKKLVEAGAIGGGVLECEDIRREYEELSAKGVK